MLGKETIGHGDLERFHIRHRPRSLVGCCRRTGLSAIDAQFDHISVPGVAVVDPSLDHETTQPSPYPAKNSRLPATSAAFTASPLDGYGLCLIT